MFMQTYRKRDTKKVFANNKCRISAGKWGRWQLRERAKKGGPSIHLVEQKERKKGVE